MPLPHPATIDAAEPAGTVQAAQRRGALPGELTLDPLPVETPLVLFDFTRLLRAARRPFATGVDRIDLAIGRGLAARFGADCLFVHAAPGGPRLLPAAAGAAFLDGLRARWHGGSRPPGAARLLARVAADMMRGGLRRAGRRGGDVTYVNASHAGLPQRRGALAALDPDRRMRRLAYIHDLMPLEYPEYQKPGTAVRFGTFLDELIGPGGPTAAPVRLLANSADTACRVARHAAAAGRPVAVTPLMPRLLPREGPPPPLRPAVRALLDDPRPFFVALGTIEPRKNHLLLLHLWRAMAAAADDHDTMPRLIVIGRRGWENEMVIDLLDRATALRPHVRECGDLSDGEAHALLGGARALLMPSFTEGLGLPLLEAGLMGVPAVVSDLPALREIGAPGTVFLDPLNGPAWRAAITALARD